MKRFPRAAMIAAMLAAALSVTVDAGASGDYGPSYSMFKAYRAPDIPLERFQAGELGVLQPGMRRVYLYTAWRAISLGPKVAAAPGTAGGLARADGSAFDHGWADATATEMEDARKSPLQGPLAILAEILQVAENDRALYKYDACPAAANEQARLTWRMLAARPDANKERRAAWVRAQYQVAEACAEAEDARYRYGNQKPPQLVLPAPLPESEPAFWRQLRDYQRAAWNFYLQRYAESTVQFERIGATRGHPMQGLGQYLALRSDIRRALAVKEHELAPRDREARALEQRGAVILADASLAPMHEPTRALLRSMRVNLTPEIRLEELNRYLDDPAADPFALDRLGDWTILMDGARPQAGKQYDFIDWIETLQGCDRQRKEPSCATQATHALQRWQQTRANTWLVAAMMLASNMPPEMERAALAVGVDDPSGLTLRYHLARLYRLAGRQQEARAVSEAALRRTLSPGTRNLFREERFAVATSVPDAAAWLLRTNVDYRKGNPAQKEDMINDDGLLWFKVGLPVAGMVELARVDSLPKPLRARAAGAAWIRASLLDKPEQGAAAAAVLAQLVPELEAPAQRYSRAGSSAERRHIALVAALRFGLSAQLDMALQPVARMNEDEVTASNWCYFRGTDFAQIGEDRFAWRLPVMPATGNADAVRDELARLAPMKTATGTVGDDVLAWLDSHPKDPELPWLLHVVVMSTRGGCLDPGASQLSRKAFNLLQKRYPGTEWARKTPYYYSPESR
ncbi:hypothetical protein AB4Z32_07820 [Massilia sp. 2TAF26]|uniref:hypothetical protein n=1 Tax=Massilia sp. 2TAF26 TaxID=3233012 RepID=UPI003F95BE29